MAFFLAALALLLHLLPGGIKPSRAHSCRKDHMVFNSRGVPLAEATVRVCPMLATGQSCTPLTPIYSESALTEDLANPTTTGPGITTKQIPNVVLPSDATLPTFSAFSLSLTGNLTVNGSTTILGNLASGMLSLSHQSTPPGSASPGNLCAKASKKKLNYKNDAGNETGPGGVDWWE